MFRAFLIIVLVLVVLVTACTRIQSEPKEIIDFLEYCQNSHQWYVDHPEFCNDPQVGNWQHQVELVEKYQEVIAWVRDQ